MSEQTVKAGKYLAIFAALLVLTGVTVGVASLHMGFAMAVLVAILVASIKGGLVASYFMHLIDENKWIYLVLIITAIFFAMLMIAPTLVTVSDYRV